MFNAVTSTRLAARTRAPARILTRPPTMPASSRAVYLEDLEAPATPPPPQRAPPEDAAPGAAASTAAVAPSASKDTDTGTGTNASKDAGTSTTASKGADTSTNASKDADSSTNASKDADTSTTASKDAGTSTGASTSANASKPSAGLKRQRTLTDMFGASASAPGPAAKKIKLSSSAGARQPSTQGSLNSIPFSLSEFQASLTDAERTLLALECDTMGKSWLKVLADEIRKPYFLKLKQFLHDAGVKGAHDSAKSLKVYPAPPNIYAWSNLTPLGRVKVAIIGQDPYHGPGQAHGLCFSVPPGVAVPPSLRNIYREIKAEYPEFDVPGHGNLTAWAENGVLLLNTCLTVQANAAGSHSNRGWEDFTDRVVDVVDRFGGANLPGAAGRGRGIVFLAWGAWAAKRVAKLDKKKHLILKSAHPSPLSAHRGFMGNGHFKAANEWLANKYGADGTVDWCKL